MTKAVLGVIGGSGIYDLPGLEQCRRRRSGASPWGEPSAPLRIGEIAGTPVVFLPRHGQGHRLSPSDINYRANIDALKRAGVTDLVSLSACGSFGGAAAGHLRAGRPVRRPHLQREARSSATAASPTCRWRIRCRRALRDRLAAAAGGGGIPVVRGGTYVCMEGPQFSTLRRELDLQGPGLSRDRHDQYAGGQARARSGALLRDRRHGHRLRLLASRPRCGDGAGHHRRAHRQRGEGQGAGGAARPRLSRASTSPVRSVRIARSTPR